MDQLDQEERLYTIAGAEDIYDDVKEPTPPMKREIVAEYLYALDGFESYLELKEEQADKPYYIPEKDELLKYQDDFYSEETKEFLDLGAYLRNVLKLKRADDVLSDLQLGARCGNSEPQMIISDVERLAGRGCFHSLEQLNEFFQYYFAMYNSTRVPSNRGFTPNEIQERMGGERPSSLEFGPNISRVLQAGKLDAGKLRQGIFDADIPVPWKTLQRVEQKKPGRNDPCPCGSGKKYKRCCGR